MIVPIWNRELRKIQRPATLVIVGRYQGYEATSARSDGNEKVRSGTTGIPLISSRLLGSVYATFVMNFV
jgi:hypothetical protein